MQPALLNKSALRRALNLRDLTDPQDGPHAMQILIDDIVGALRQKWGCEVRLHRESPIVSLAANYDALRYPVDGAARDARYTRYVTETAVLRTMASAMVPGGLRAIADALPDDALLVCPGLVYRRDCIDRLHCGEPHQLDLWRIHQSKRMDGGDLEEMIAVILKAALPDHAWRIEPRVHPYTLDGLQIDVESDGEWIEIGECGLAHPDILSENLPHAGNPSGLALGLGMDRLLMIRKSMRDIRLLRSKNPRVAAQMLDLALYREVSSMPPVIRDVSLVLDEETSVEQAGDEVRSALGDDAELVECVEILSQTRFRDLPAAAVERLGMSEGQVNVLLRIVLRAVDRTLTSAECNVHRDAIYAALHRGQTWHWAAQSDA